MSVDRISSMPLAYVYPFACAATIDDGELKVETWQGLDNLTYHIKLLDSKPTGEVLTITLDFVSQLTDTLQGFYKGLYKDEDSGNIT